MKVDERYPEKEFRAGEIIFRQGDPSRALYILLEGRLAVIEDQVCIASISDPGAVVGESAYLIGCDRLADVKAETDCRLQIIDDVEKFFRDDPKRGLEIARLLAERLRDMDLKFLELRKLVKKLGGDVPEEESDLPDELKVVRRYLKAWQVSI
ncbi:cyclic nucleotide-binding domain-containing protein [Acidobacteria bacterium AH-259-D05]|nr:cyclic nucleotide-binding domain-containing protein [Acidobacteria bacterium AH-259-D05]